MFPIQYADTPSTHQVGGSEKAIADGESAGTENPSVLKNNSTLGRETAMSGVAHGKDWSTKVRRTQPKPVEQIEAPAEVSSAPAPKEKFSFRRALKSVGRGVVHGFKHIAEAFRERPLTSIATFGAMVGASILFPVVMEVAIPVLALGVSGYQAFTAIRNALKADNPRDAEDALSGLGEALAGVGLMATGLVLSRFLHAMKHAAALHLLDDAPVVLSILSSIFGKKEPEEPAAA